MMCRWKKQMQLIFLYHPLNKVLQRLKVFRDRQMHRWHIVFASYHQSTIHPLTVQLILSAWCSYQVTLKIEKLCSFEIGAVGNDKINISALIYIIYNCLRYLVSVTVKMMPAGKFYLLIFYDDAVIVEFFIITGVDNNNFFAGQFIQLSNYIIVSFAVPAKYVRPMNFKISTSGGSHQA